MTSRRPLLVAAALLLLVAAAACSPGTPVTRAPAAPVSALSDRARVTELLDRFHAAAARADEAAYFACLAEGAVFLGTDATERWSTAEFRAYAHPHFAKGKAWSFRARRRDVTFDPRGKVAWFDEDLVTENLGPARGSGVAVEDGGAWRIVQYNLAITVPNDRFKEVKTLLETPPRL